CQQNSYWPHFTF
nr:immunoglobulin light chain junction region [Macaca mulatta]MOV62255.1 immunoglobulin light chain junction region [Macaca mulatta]MOV62885.1 immunoglobulin light chain junction region [Macaca mulatta]